MYFSMNIGSCHIRSAEVEQIIRKPCNLLCCLELLPTTKLLFKGTLHFLIHSRYKEIPGDILPCILKCQEEQELLPAHDCAAFTCNSLPNQTSCQPKCPEPCGLKQAEIGSVSQQNGVAQSQCSTNKEGQG